MMNNPLDWIKITAQAASKMLNRHFDRSEFTNTHLQQAPESAGDSRTGAPFGATVTQSLAARLPTGENLNVRTIGLAAGTLDVLTDRHTSRRMIAAEGNRSWLIAIRFMYKQPGVGLGNAERPSFYVRICSTDGSCHPTIVWKPSGSETVRPRMWAATMSPAT